MTTEYDDPKIVLALAQPVLYGSGGTKFHLPHTADGDRSVCSTSRDDKPWVRKELALIHAFYDPCQKCVEILESEPQCVERVDPDSNPIGK